MDKPTLTFGSLFSGIGGLDLGLERAGMHCAWQVEIDDYAQKILAKHWPNVTRLRDVREGGKHNLAYVDLIAGGFPCQDISIAGKRAGITGERSGLWKEFYRIICELRPRFVLVENVAALLYGGIDTVLGDLAESGYDAEWQIVSAEAVGAPHLRERIFIVGYAMRIGCGRQGIQHDTGALFGARGQDGSQVPNPHGNGCGQRTIQPQCQPRRILTTNTSNDGAQGYVANPDFQGLEVGACFGKYARQELAAIERDRRAGTNQWAIEPRLDRVANGVPHRMDRLRGLGNAVVPQVAEFVGRCIMAAEAERQVSYAY